MNATDADGDALTWIVSSQPTNGVLSGSPPNLLYLPKTNFFGVDGFRWRVYDGLESSPTISVAIAITPVPDVDAVRLQIFRNPPFVDVNLSAEPWVSVSIETSPDLTHWTTWRGPFVNTFSQGLFTDWDPAPTNRFFRARQGP